MILDTWATGAPSSQVAWTLETVRLIRNADPEQGKALSGTCAGCHGPEGVAVAPTFPHIAGQRPDYLYKQLMDYKNGSRQNAIMQGMVAALDEQAMANLAAYYASLSPPPPTPAQGDFSKALPLVQEGDGTRLIPACDGCHAGITRRRHKGMAIINGLQQPYLTQTLQAYKAGTRANDIYSVMRTIASQLTDEEINQLAAYYAAQATE